MKRMENAIGVVLLFGVLASALMVLLGGVLFLVRHGGTPVHFRVFRGEPTYLSTLGGIWTETLHDSSRGIIQMGLLLLVAVQLVRVGLTGVLFGLSRDKAFVVISTLVLGLLTYALFFAGR